TAIGYILHHPNKGGEFEHLGGMWFLYGDAPILDDQASPTGSQPPLPPKARAPLIIPGEILQNFRKTIAQRCRGCGPPELILWKVAFADGSGLDTVADNGYVMRAWAPKPPSKRGDGKR